MWVLQAPERRSGSMEAASFTRIKYERLEKLREKNFVAIKGHSCIISHKQDIGGTFTVSSTSITTNHPHKDQIANTEML